MEDQVQTLFGTDGIRGTANVYPMTPKVAMKVGQALGHILKQQPSRREKTRTVLIGKDTRLSGYMIEQALASGLNSTGINVQLTGPLPTPGIGFVAKNMRVDAGVVISASHNPFSDNGIKIFGSDGFKISEELEKEIETMVFENTLDKHLASPSKVGRTRRIEDAMGRYIVHVKNTFPFQHDLSGLHIVLDCAHGAAYHVAPAIFEELGAKITVLSNTPNGRNINKNCGALFPENICQAVVKYEADVGISLDGDADRCLMSDEKGHLLNGDHILAIMAISRAKHSTLTRKTVVTTEMSNLGLENILNQHKIKLIRTKIGDKYIVEEMRKKDLSLGGEPSGHIICLKRSTTGDGCVAALNVLAIMQEENKKLSTLRNLMKEVPQTLLNLKIKEKKDLNQVSGYNEFIEKKKNQLKKGRIFIRYSGTEPVLRILVEGSDKKQVSQCAQSVYQFLETRLNI